MKKSMQNHWTRRVASVFFFFLCTPILSPSRSTIARGICGFVSASHTCSPGLDELVKKMQGIARFEKNVYLNVIVSAEAAHSCGLESTLHVYLTGRLHHVTLLE